MAPDPEAAPVTGSQQVDPRATPLAGPELCTALLNFVQQAATTGKLRAGANEALKQATRQKCCLMVLAADTSPLEIVLHLILVCEDRGVPYVFVPSKKALGNASKLSVDVIACGIEDHPSLRPTAERLVTSIEQLV